MKNNNTEVKKERNLQLDLLRIIACFSVIMIHSASQYMYGVDIHSFNWIVSNSYDSINRFGVPIFVMMSGALFLNPDKEFNISSLYKKNILRLAIIYLVWTVVYGFWNLREWDFSILPMDILARKLVSGGYHLWYIPYGLGLYVCVPILRKWLANAEKKNVEYFLWLFFILCIGRETLKVWITNSFFDVIHNIIQAQMICSYIGYFILGYYLSHYEISSKRKKWIYILGAISVVGNILSGNLVAFARGHLVSEIYDSFTIFTFFMVVAIFTFFATASKKKWESNACGIIVKELSADTLGIYLVHIILLEGLQMLGINSTFINPVFGVPVLALFVFIVGAVMAALLRRIPFLGKYVA